MGFGERAVLVRLVDLLYRDEDRAALESRQRANGLVVYQRRISGRVVVKLYTVNCDGWDNTNGRCYFKWGSIIETVGLLWDPGNGRTVSLFVNGEFRAELWRDVPPDIYPVFNLRSYGNGRPSVRQQDIPALENAYYKKVTDLDPPSVALLPPLLRDQATKRKKNDYRDLYKNRSQGV